MCVYAYVHWVRCCAYVCVFVQLREHMLTKKKRREGLARRKREREREKRKEDEGMIFIVCA